MNCSVHNSLPFNFNVCVSKNYNYQFTFSQHECIQIHEHDIKRVRRKPDFDVDTVIVALKQAG